MTRDKLEPFFDRPLRQAAKSLNISATALKSLCRKLKVWRAHPRTRRDRAVCRRPCVPPASRLHPPDAELCADFAMAVSAACVVGSTGPA